MKIETKKLLEAINEVKPAAVGQLDDLIEEKSSFVFTGKQIICDNGVICIAHPLRTPFKCSVSSNEFYKVVNLITSKFLIVSFNEEKGKLLIKSRRNRLNINVIVDSRTMLDSFKLSERETAKPPSDFIDGLSRCLFTVSKEKSADELQNVFIDGEYIKSTDRFRISRYKMKSSIKRHFVMPYISAVNLCKYDVEKFCIKDGSIAVFIAKNKTVFCTSLSSDKFPVDAAKHFSFKGENLNLPDKIKSMIKLSTIFADGQLEHEKRIYVKIAENKIYISGENDFGKVENDGIIDYASKNAVQFFINPSYLLEAMESLTSVKIGEDRVLFSSKNFNHLIALYV